MAQTPFIYTGAAAGVSAVFTRIDPADHLNHVVPVQGSSWLPVTGGLSESHVDNYVCFVDDPRPITLVAAKHIFTHVSGRPPHLLEHDYVTKARCSIERVRFIDRISINHIDVELKSEHAPDAPFPQIKISDDAKIEGMFIDGLEVSVDIDTGDANQCERRADLAGRFQNVRQGKEYSVVSVVTNIRIKDKPQDVVIAGNVVTWPGIGSITFGQLVVSDSSRRLTMVRLNLGSAVDGSGSAGEVHANGVMP
jgi:hypothetical protein